ncbi:HpsJ family protein [Tumidithrix elongata RA019]|uniref:HpsJ family protein n=1 Tax=Tumidithrix elongata BACA0141 TaxID=2716417 RepID=A0AAW9Q5U7_9CYAN|nr:HpsJ family protein [Tumidithrix elongata RA019]
MSSNIEPSVYLFRFVGYGLLLLALSNFADALLPPRLTDEAWVFQTLGSLVGSVPVPLLGFVLVFYGEPKERTSLRKITLKFFSWLSLLLAIFFFAVMFAGISVTIRINNSNNIQANFQLSRQATQFQQAIENLKKVSDDDLVRGATAMQQQNNALKLDLNDPTALRKQLEAEITKKDTDGKAQIEAARQGVSNKLIKQSIKWNFEALISAGLFLGIWRLTGWARTTKKRKKKRPESQSAVSLDALVGLSASEPPTNSAPISDSPLDAPVNASISEHPINLTDSMSVPLDTLPTSETPTNSTIPATSPLDSLVNLSASEASTNPTTPGDSQENA